MLKKTIYKSSLVLLLIFANACDGWLYLEPQDAIVKQEFWKTKEQAYSALIGCYASLLDADLGDKMFLWGELRADMIKPTEVAPSSAMEVVNGNILDTNPISNWGSFYKTINYCNTLIDFAPEVQKHDPTFSNAALNTYMAEARAIRSLMYFYLVRSFGEVPYKLEATVSDDQNLRIPKSSQEVILQGILNDLKIAEAGALTLHENRQASKGRFTKYSINALQADVYLWSEKYDSCLMACDKIINSGQYGLIEGANEWFNSIFVNGNSNESLFEIQYGNRTHPFFRFLWNQPNFIAPSYVVDQFYTIDYNDSDNRDIRGTNASVRGAGTIWKYIGTATGQRRENAGPYPNWIVYRYADVLLMKADALAQLNRGQEALDIVSVIRTRARALEGSERGVEAGDVEGITEYILEERAREFAFEGKRWFDILRVAKRNNYQRLDLLLDMVTRSAPVDKQQTLINKYRDTYSHYFPIFLYDLQTNKSLEQNPFYLK